MKKDILLAVISEAIDKGASISIHMGQYHMPGFKKVSEKEAFTIAQMVADALGEEVVENDDSDGGPKGVHDYTVYRGKYDIRFAASFHKYMEEDIDLTGRDYEEGEAHA